MVLMLSSILKFLPFTFMGLSTGMTIAILSSIDIWLALNGVSKTTIGFFVLCKIPYTIKFIFVPFIESHKPFKWLPIRKSWILFSHLGITFSIIAIALSKPSPSNITQLFILSLMLMFSNALQNITAYNFQVDRVKSEDLGFVTSVVTFGYRIGILLSTAGVLLLSNYVGWKWAFIMYACVSFLSSCSFFLRQEPLHNNFMKEGSIAINKLFSKRKINMIKRMFIKVIILPLMSTRNKVQLLAMMFMLAIIKVPDDMAHKMARLMYLEIGFNTLEIAHYVNNLGFFATIAGGFIVGFLVKGFGVQKTLIMSVFVHAATFLCYILIWSAGHNSLVLAFTIVSENITGGMLMSAFIAELYTLSSTARSPSFMYAFLWCIYNIMSMSSVAFSGVMVEKLGWVNFFLSMMIIATTGGILICRKNK